MKPPTPTSFQPSPLLIKRFPSLTVSQHQKSAGIEHGLFTLLVPMQRKVSGSRLATTANLLLVHFKGVAILHVERVGVILRRDPLTVKEEAHT